MPHQSSPHYGPDRRIPYALTARLRADMRRMIHDELAKFVPPSPGPSPGPGGLQIALDEDGVPFFTVGTGVPGTHSIALDTDGVPYLTIGV